MGFSHDYDGIFDRPLSVKKPPKRVYLCGPMMTGQPDLNFSAFDAEAERLRKLGYSVFNPVELLKQKASRKRGGKGGLQPDLTILLTCNILVLLDGWEESRDARFEMNIANSIGIEITLAKDIQAAEFIAKERQN